MKLTIITENNQVGKDHYFYDHLSLSSCNIPENVWALQWNNSSGHIEYNDGSTNLEINELPAWAIECVKVWDAQHQMELNPPHIPNTAEQNKQKASELLSDTDWVENPSVVDTSSSLYLTNKSEFDSYRLQLRLIAVNPVDGDIEFPSKPSSVWSS